MKKLSTLFCSFFIVTILVTLNLSASGQSPNPVVTLIQPDVAGIKWVRNTNNMISWTDNFVMPVMLELCTDLAGTHTVTTIASSVEGSTFVWNTDVAPGHYYVRVSSTVDYSYHDVSANSFEVVIALPGVAKVYQPSVSGITWQVGTSHLISWEIGSNENTIIELIGTTTPTTTTLLTTGGPVSGSTWTWDINPSLDIRSDYKIRVTGATTGVTAISDHTFSVSETLGGTINVIQPNVANIEWKPGTTHLISWEDYISEPVNIYLINGTTSPTIEELLNTGGPVTGSTWNWTIPSGQTVDENYRIRICSSINSGNCDESNADFAIVHYLNGHVDRVIQPKDGDTWLLGTGHLISWEDELEESVDITLYIYPDGSGTSTPTTTLLIGGATGSTWPWTSVGPVSNYCKIGIKSHDNTAVPEIFSTGYFKIVNTIAVGGGQFFQPLAGTKWLRNTTYLISWEDYIPEAVDVWISDDNGGTFTKTIEDVVGSTCLWTSPNVSSGNNYQIKITSSIDPGISFLSGFFTIVESLGGGAITINQPNQAGLKWVQGTTNLISWDDNLTESVNIYLIDAGGVTSTITTSVTGTTYSWSIPVGQSVGMYRIYITSSMVGGPSKLAENQFEIVQLIDVGVYPNPCSQYTTIEFDETSSDNYTVMMFDRFGTAVLEQSINTAETKQLNISTSDLPNGIYFLNMTAGKTQIAKKVVIQH